MALDWSQCPAVESIPGKVSGAWVLRGARMPVEIVFDVTAEQVRSVLHFVGESLRDRRS